MSSTIQDNNYQTMINQVHRFGKIQQPPKNIYHAVFVFKITGLWGENKFLCQFYFLHQIFALAVKHST